MPKCNNCGWIGNENALTPLFEFKGVTYTSAEVNKLNLNEEVEDMYNGCPVCKTDSYLSDIQAENIVTIAIDEGLVGTIEDNDQLFYQKGFINSTVATFDYVTKSGEKYLIEVVNNGEQRISVAQNNEGDLLSIEDGGEFELLYNNPSKLLEAMRLEKETEKEYIYQGDSCWLDVEVYKKGIKLGNYYDTFGSVFGSISEAINAVCDEGLSQMGGS